jgi:hypothetical protein
LQGLRRELAGGELGEAVGRGLRPDSDFAAVSLTVMIPRASFRKTFDCSPVMLCATRLCCVPRRRFTIAWKKVSRSSCLLLFFASPSSSLPYCLGIDPKRACSKAQQQREHLLARQMKLGRVAPDPHTVAVDARRDHAGLAAPLGVDLDVVERRT